MQKNHCLLLAAGVVFMALAGCQKGDALVDVTGTVFVDGKPMPGLQLTFIPVNDGGSTAYGFTDERGRYRLRFSRDRMGAQPGMNNVLVELPSRANAEELAKAGLPVPPEGAVLPSKYSLPGELQVEISARGGDYPIELTSDG